MAETRAASREPTVFHFVHISAVKAPSWFPQELSEETKQHLPPPPSALVHMILEHKREGVDVSRARFTWRSEDCLFNTPTLWWELELMTMLFLLWIPKALKSGVNDLPVSCCILLMDFKDIFSKIYHYTMFCLLFKCVSSSILHTLDILSTSVLRPHTHCVYKIGKNPELLTSASVLHLLLWAQSCRIGNTLKWGLLNTSNFHIYCSF